MHEAINPDLKVLIFRIVGPLFLIGFALLTGFVAKRLPPQGLFGWKICRIGGFVAIFGLMIAAYFSAIEVGAALVGVGWLLVVIGGIKFFAAWVANSKK